jgi:hypothetical protein
MLVEQGSEAASVSDPDLDPHSINFLAPDTEVKNQPKLREKTEPKDRKFFKKVSLKYSRQ